MSDFEYAEDLAAHGASLQPDEATLDRMSRRLAMAEAKRRPRSRWLGIGAVSMLAAAGIAAMWLSGPSPILEVDVGDGTFSLADGIVGEAMGVGQAHVDGTRTGVRLQSGRLSLDVPPGAGLTVVVETEESVVTVLGTAFTVERGGFGTDVSVARGKVEVRCRASGHTSVLTPGTQTFCLRDPGAGLGRLLALEGEGAPPGEQLDVIEAALALPDGLDATRVTLSERRVAVLAALGRTEAAIDAARALPASPRRAVLQDTADRELAAGGCAAADPWLAELQATGDVIGTLVRVQCLSDSDPAGARAALQTLNPRELSPGEAAAATAWERSLPR